MELRQAFKFFVTVWLILAWANSAQAGFGVSPPWVIAEHLLKGSHFEQTIYLVQGQPKEDLIAKVKIDESVVKDWVSIDRGMEFRIPAGIQQFPMKVLIDVPQDVELGDYKGSLRVQAGKETFKEGAVSVVLGAVVDLKLRVTEEEFLSFIVRSAKIKKMEEGWPVKIYFNVENTGNIRGRPSKATLEIWNINLNKLLETSEFSDFDYIEPFETKEIVAEFSNQLSVGQYWGVFKIYHDDVALRQDKQVFDVLEEGSLSGWRGLVANASEWLTWQKIIWILLGTAILGVLIWLKRKFKIKIINVITLPIRILRKLLRVRITFKE